MQLSARSYKGSSKVVGRTVASIFLARFERILGSFLGSIRTGIQLIGAVVNTHGTDQVVSPSVYKRCRRKDDHHVKNIHVKVRRITCRCQHADQQVVVRL